ncbi:hypothetical protein GCM10009847_10750 [Leucobacter tardus]
MFLGWESAGEEAVARVRAVVGPEAMFGFDERVPGKPGARRYFIHPTITQGVWRENRPLKTKVYDLALLDQMRFKFRDSWECLIGEELLERLPQGRSNLR